MELSRTAVTLASLAMASSSLPAREAWSFEQPPLQPIRETLAGAQSPLRSGELTPNYQNFTLRNPIVAGPYENIFLNSWLLGQDAAQRQVLGVSSVLSDAVRMFYCDEPGNGAEGEVVRPLQYALSHLARHIETRIRNQEEVHLIAAGTGSIVLMGALKQLELEITQRNPVERRELLARVHVVLLGDPGELESENGDKQIDAVSEGFSADLGSMFVIRRVKPDGTVLDDCGADRETIESEILPQLKPEMLRESGEQRIVVTENGLSPEERILEIARARDTMKRVGEHVRKAELSLVMDQVRVAAEKAERADIANAIGESIERMRMLEYSLENAEYDQNKIAEKMREIGKVLKEVSVLQQELEKSNLKNEESVTRLAAKVRAIQTMMIEFALSMPRPGVNSEITVRAFPPPSEKANNKPDGDFDGDGVLNEVESKLLDRWRPVLALNRTGHRAPISVSEHRAHADDRGDRLDLREKTWVTDADKSLWYGRVAKPDELQRYGKNVHLIQHYALFSYNSCGQAVDDTVLVHGLDVLFTALAGIGDVDIQALGGKEKESILGNHEADVICVDQVVEVDEKGDSRLLFIVVHNHGRQYAVEVDGVTFHEGRPVVFAEQGTQELLLNAGPGGFGGLDPRMQVNKVERGVVDEDEIVHDHHGQWLLSSMPAWNMGEVLSNEHGQAIVGPNGWATAVDTRTFESGSIEAQRQEDGRFFMTYPHPLGNSYYRLYVSVGIPFTSFRKKLVDERFDSPSGPTFNSVEGDSLKAGIIRGKMWHRRYELDADSARDNPKTATHVQKITGPDGVDFAWSAVPSANCYLIRIQAPGRPDELAIPGFTGQLVLTGLGHVSSWKHDEDTGWEPGVPYTYTFEMISGAHRRPMPLD